MKDLNVSMIQSDIHWEEREANMAMFEEKIHAIEKTDLIVLPEMFTTGFTMNPERLAEPAGGRTFQWMKQMALQKNSAIVGSYIVKESGNYFNRLYFVRPDGSSDKYDKKHLFNLAGEGNNYAPGSERLVVEYKGWKICPLICYDLRFPVWSRSRSTPDSLYEYDLLIYVANWPDARVDAWDTLLKGRAIENLSYCIGVNRIGTDKLSKTYPGHSAVYSFAGETITFAKEDEAVFASLSSEGLKEFRTNFPFQKDADVLN